MTRCRWILVLAVVGSGCSVVFDANRHLPGQEGDGGRDGGRDAGSDGGLDAGGCADDMACSDGDPCNGFERCADSACFAGDWLDHGTACGTPSAPRGVCRVTPDAATCVPADQCGNGVVEGDEVCDDGNLDDEDGCTAECTFTCVEDIDCGDDGDACNGIERCDQVEHVCVTDTPPMPRWYADCDGDGFAASGAASVERCQEPETPPSCGTGSSRWVALEPTERSNTDCHDSNPAVRPGASAWHSTPGGGEVPFDYNCDGFQERELNTVGVSSSAACTPNCDLCGCSGATGWTSSTPPSCGQSGQYSFCVLCARRLETRVQRCR